MREPTETKVEGLVLPILLAVLFVLSLSVPALFKWSVEGPGSKAAPWIVALICGAVVGALCQRSRLCMAGGIRDVVMFKDFNLVTGFIAIIVTVLAGNLILGGFKLGFAEQAVAHTDGLWNFLGMALVGWGSILLGGCPLRQLILAGEGNGDSAVTVFGMIFGAAIAHNLGLAGSADSVVDGVYKIGGTSPKGMIAVVIGFVVLLIVSLTHLPKKGE